jgi:ribonuclease E
MLINARNPEEVRVAILVGESLESYQVEVAERGLQRGNIYRGVIASIQPSLNAAFVDFGAEKHGFLAIQDVVPDAWYRQPANAGRPRIDEVLERGKPIVVQVEKEAEGSKGAALTTNLSLAGRYLVLTPFDSVMGVSRKVEDEDSRKELKQLAASLKVPDGCGVIVRTNALDQNKTALSRDLAALLRVWKRVEAGARSGRGTRLLYSDQDLLQRALRDYLENSIGEVLVDDDAAFDKAADYMRAFMPRTKTKLIRYEDRTPIFSKYNLEPQIDRIYERTVPLPSGGSLVIDRTEALTAIDVNSGRATRAASQEETALHTNLEAAKEVARQLRLRDIGGLVVVDFIDMRSQKSQRRLEKELREAMKADKARSTVGKISPNGLLEINRQRIQQALLLRTHRPCPTCGGMGRISSPEMVGLGLLRRIQARAASGTMKGVRIGLHPELADALQNGRRHEIAELEHELDVKVEILSSRQLGRSEQKIEWIDREPGDERRPPPPAPRPERAERTVLDLSGDDEEDDFEESEEREDHAEGNGNGNGEGADGRRRSRRRRRGRRRGRSGAEGDAPVHAQGQAHSPGQAQGHGQGQPKSQAEPQAQPQPQGPAQPKSGRGQPRGDRRGRRSAPAAGAPATASAQAPALAAPGHADEGHADEVMHDAAPGEGGTPAEGGGRPKRRRRRGGRRRGGDRHGNGNGERGADAGEGPHGESAGAGATATAAAPEPAEPRRPAAEKGPAADAAPAGSWPPAAE